MAILPTELYERVIDARAAEDLLYGAVLEHYSKLTYSNLLSCALTCRAWLPRSRYHILRTIHITSQTTLYRLEGALHNTHRTPVVFDRLIVDPRRDSWISFCLRLSSIACQIRSLAFTGGLCQFAHPSLFMTLPLFRLVSTLSLTTSDFTSLHQLIRLIHCFPNLRHLRLHDTFEPIRLAHVEESFVSSPNESLLVCLTQLEIYSDLEQMVAGIEDWLTVSGSAASLQHVSLYSAWARSMASVSSAREMLSAASVTLQYLEISLSVNGPEMLDRLGLHEITFYELKCIRFWINARPQDGIHSLCKVLHKLSGSLSIRRMEFRMVIRTQENISDLAWIELDTALSRPHFREMESLTIYLEVKEKSYQEVLQMHPPVDLLKMMRARKPFNLLLIIS
ncbi:hypothetical protein ABKN59_005792 [Abortiporus biennis]